MYDLAVFISGPETSYTSYYRDTELKFLNKIAKMVVTIGDGHRAIINDDYQTGELFDILNTLKSIAFDQKVIILLHCHGQTKDGLHLMQLKNMDNSHWFPTRNIFKCLTNTLNCPVDIILESCGAHGVITDIGILPSESKVMLANKVAAIHMPLITMKSFVEHATNFDLEFYFQSYILRLNVNAIPIIIKSNRGKIDPVETAVKFLGKPIARELQDELIQKFVKSICHKDQQALTKFKNILDKIQHATNLSEFALFGNESVKNIKRIHLKILKELPRFNELSQFKVYADNLLQAENIPIRVNISNDFWKKDAYIFSEKHLDQEQELIHKQTQDYIESALLDILTMGIYLKAADYSYPEIQDYGMALWIIYALQKYVEEDSMLTNADYLQSKP